MNHTLLRLGLVLLTTTTIVITQDNDIAHIVNSIEQKSNITCLCTEDELCEENTRTCTLKHPNNVCYESWSLEPGENTIHVTAGCVYNDYLIMRLFCDMNQTSRYIVCCSQRDYCNDLDAYSRDIRHDLLHSVSKPDIQVKIPPPRGWTTLGLIVAVTSVVVIASLVLFLWFYLRKNKLKTRRATYPKPMPYPKEQTRKTFIQRLLNYLPQQIRSKSDLERSIQSDQSLSILLADSSTSTMGCALPLLMQRTLARQITLMEEIGAGRYGSVRRGKWREDNVAVKIFSANDECSWFREIDIYQTVCLRHENILGYIAADNIDASTHTQLWLVTEYQENGSVFDYLKNHTITLPVMVKMMLSIASGLCHLHMPIDSTNGKVALAHRDLKTKNILVKKDLSCCIADLGLAVKEVRSAPTGRRKLVNGSHQPHVVIDIKANSRVGTQRYMAPEVLDGTINDQSFESFKAADIYALGLVYWEILRRCQTNPIENDADDYQVPYEDLLPNNPTFDQMRDLVCTRKIRPPPSARWQTHPVLRHILRLCEELWIEEPTCRLSSLNIKKQLKTQSELVENELSNSITDSQQQSKQNDGPWTA